MKLTILGGGGFRVPLVYGALLRQEGHPRIDEVALHDVDAGRLVAIEQVLRQQAAEASAAGGPPPPRVAATTDVDAAIDGADFVFSAIRVGGLAGRTCDERVALSLGVLGQETTGPGGLAFGLRTVPVALDIARRIAAHAPTAWVVNFTNPAGMITQAMQAVLPGRVVGICDSPIGLIRRACAALGLPPQRVSADYLGLNHLGWLRALHIDGRDALPDLLADDRLLAGIEEGRLFGADWLRALGAIPNEYLYYYDFTREALAGITGSAQTRGEFLLHQQDALYVALAADPASALAQWRRARAERDATYMKEARAGGQTRDAADIAGGGYEAVALELMHSLARGRAARMILNVPGGHLVPGLAGHAVVETPCHVDGSGVTPLAPPGPPLAGRMAGLVQQVKHVEELTIRAAATGDAGAALQAFASHPLVDSVTTARELLAGYRAAIPAVDAVFR